MALIAANPPGVWGARGRGFSMGLAAPPGHHLVHLTGQVAWDAGERIVGPGDVAEQTRQCFRNIRAVLAPLGATLDDLVAITTWYLAPGDLATIQAVRGEFLTSATPPASTSVMVAGLGDPAFLVELTPVAAIPPDRFRARTEPMPAYLTANDTPGRHPASWYAATAHPLPEHPPLAGEARADVCVVGGGYAGLSAALHLAERGYDVALVEANRIGWGASGRNGGQLGIGPRADIRSYEKAVGPDAARRVWDIALEANRLVRDLIARHAIDCDLADGYLEAAWRPSDYDEIRAFADHVAKHYGHELTLLDRDRLYARLPSRRYHGGFLDPMGAHLHPLNLALGLGGAAAAAGVRIFEQSRATALAPGRVATAAGTVRAETVILAMNGYLDGLEPRVQARSMPINNFIGVTEPLEPEAASRLIVGNPCVCDTKFVLNYYRLTPDNRLLWGGGESYAARFPRDLAAVVRRKMAEVFPDLADLPFSHVWGGTLAITGTRMPAFQRLDARTLAISGWSGSGIHMATMGGRIAAEAVAGQMERWDVLAALPTPAFPGGAWFRAPLLALAMSWYALRDRL